MVRRSSHDSLCKSPSGSMARPRRSAMSSRSVARLHPRGQKAQEFVSKQASFVSEQTNLPPLGYLVDEAQRIPPPRDVDCFKRAKAGLQIWCRLLLAKKG